MWTKTLLSFLSVNWAHGHCLDLQDSSSPEEETVSSDDYAYGNLVQFYKHGTSVSYTRQKTAQFFPSLRSWSAAVRDCLVLHEFLHHAENMYGAQYLSAPIFFLIQRFQFTKPNLKKTGISQANKATFRKYACAKSLFRSKGHGHWHVLSSRK